MSSPEEHLARIRAALAPAPTLSWLHAMSEATDQLARAITGALAGSSRSQPERAIRELRQVQQLTVIATQAVAVASDQVDTYLARHGVGAGGFLLTSWQGPRPAPMPAPPETTVAAVARFVQQCQRILVAESLSQAADQTNHARSRLASAAGLAPPSELSIAISALSQAQQALRDAAPRVASANQALTEYHAGVLGSAVVAQRT